MKRLARFAWLARLARLARRAPLARGFVLASLACWAAAPAARAEGALLDGLMAPELAFGAGLNGVAPGTTLSSFRGQVVWVKFWLRDCPHCRATLPKVQELHELLGKSGLVILTVVHQYAPEQVKPFLDQSGYTFRVGCDPSGALAQAYQVNRRPTDYVIGVDGRVKSSNGAPEEVIAQELGRYRVAELGRVPAGLEAVKEKVQAWDYGSALKAVLAAAAAPQASLVFFAPRSTCAGRAV